MRAWAAVAANRAKTRASRRMGEEAPVGCEGMVTRGRGARIEGSAIGVGS